MQLVDALEKHGENWEEIVKVFNGKRTKQDCLLHLIQLPIKDNIIFKLGEGPVPKSEKVEKIEKIENSALPKGKDDILNAINDQNNPIIAQVVFFAKMFDKFVQEDLKAKQEEKVEKVEISNSQQDSCQINQNLNSKDFSSAQELKEIIYKTYTKSIDRSKELRENEKNKMEKIMNLLVYLQMKKIEMKLSYFNDFEKLIQFETQQMKSMESQVIQDRIKLAIKKNELMSIAEKMKKEAREISISSEKAKDSSNVVNSNSNCNGSSNNLPQISEQSAIGSISFKGPILDPEPRVLALDP
jgi:SWI/SNF related-matrix-associated actin-dependent regulator of chromatin subfamily C